MVVIVKLNVTAANADRIQQVTHLPLKSSQVHYSVMKISNRHVKPDQSVARWWLVGGWMVVIVKSM